MEYGHAEGSGPKVAIGDGHDVARVSDGKTEEGVHVLPVADEAGAGVQAGVGGGAVGHRVAVGAEVEAELAGCADDERGVELAVGGGGEARDEGA